MSIRCRARTGLLLSTTLVALAGPVAAQEEGIFQMLGRIILGTGTAKVAIDTPQAVTALEQEDLDRKQALNIGELLKGVPGVQAAGASARPLGQAFNIRGIGNSEQTASEERIKIVVDGAPKFFEAYRLGSFFSDLDLYKRVEILRGPASSTLYGSGAIGGVILFTTKDASDYLAEDETTALQFKLAGTTNGSVLKPGVTFATRHGNAEFLASLNGTRGDEMQDGAGSPILGTEHSGTAGLLKGKFTFGNDSDQSLTFAVSRTDTEQIETPVAQTGGSALPLFGTHDLFATDDTATLTWNHGFAANPLLDLTVQLSFTDTDVSKRNFSLGAGCAVGNSQVLCDSDYAYRALALKVENTADISSGDWENYLTFGVQLSEQDRIATSSLGAFGFHPEGVDRRTGVYAQGEFVWNDRLTIIPGLRVDFGEKLPSDAVIARGGRELQETAVSPKIAILYQFNDTWGVFGNLARTERMPTLDELYSNSATQDPALNLEMEEANSAELGFTFQREGLLSEGDSLQLKATGFYNDITNLIARTTTGPVFFDNVRSAEIWGAELEASYDAERWFASLAWSHVKSKDGSTGRQLQDTPAENVALTLGAKLPDQGLVIGWKAYYFDGITNYANGTTTPSATYSGSNYDTHDLFVTWSPQSGALQGFDLNLTVENVFDADYRNNLSLDRAAGMNAKLSITKGFTW